MTLTYFLPIIVAFVITLTGLILLKPLALRLGLVDKPGGRKHHEGDVPLIGGIAMFFGFTFSLLTLQVSLSDYRCLIASTALLVITGVLDDFHELAPRARLLVQIIAAGLMMTWGNNVLHNLGNLFYWGGNINLYGFAYPITALIVLAVINAVNMTDGTDGLAASISFIELIFLGILADRANLFIDSQIIYLLLAVVLAFLCFNFPLRKKAQIFMGDSGSMMLGFVLSWFCISMASNGIVHPVTFLWILAMPLWDISSVVIRRVMGGASPMKADRGHIHHSLLARGFSPLKVTVVISLLSAVLGAIGMMSEIFEISQSIMFLGFLGLFGIYHWSREAK